MQKIYPTSRIITNSAFYNLDYERRPFLILGYSENITSYLDEPFGTNFYENILNDGNKLLIAKFTTIQLVKENFAGTGQLSIYFNNIRKSLDVINDSSSFPTISDLELLDGYNGSTPERYYTLVSAVILKSQISSALESDNINLLGAINIIDSNYTYSSPITHDYDVYNLDTDEITSGHTTPIINRIIPISMISTSNINIASANDYIHIMFLLS